MNDRQIQIFEGQALSLGLTPQVYSWIHVDNKSGADWGDGPNLIGRLEGKLRSITSENHYLIGFVYNDDIVTAVFGLTPDGVLQWKSRE